MPVDDQGQRSCSKGTSSAYGPGQELRNRGQRDLATETDARLTRNVSHDASVVISQQNQVKFQIFCRCFVFAGEVLVILETRILDAQFTSRILDGLTRWRGSVEPRKGIGCGERERRSGQRRSEKQS